MGMWNTSMGMYERLGPGIGVLARYAALLSGNIKWTSGVEFVRSFVRSESDIYD